MRLINGLQSDDAHYAMGLGVAVGSYEPADAGRCASFEWGGMTSTVFWVDQTAGLGVVCFSQLSPSVVYPLRSELKQLIYGCEELFPEGSPAALPAKPPAARL